MLERIMPRAKEFGILFVLIALVIVLSLLSPNFLAVNNLLNIGGQVATYGICAVGFTFVLITGGIDLSVGYQISINVVVCALLMKNVEMPWPLAVIVVLALGTLIGLINGVIITVTGVAPLIVTLAMMTILNGVSYLISGGLPIFGFDEGFKAIGQGNVAGIPISLIVLAVAWAIGLFVLNKTYFGRYLYAIGNNVEAARLSGVNTKRTLIWVYAIAGFFTAIGAILLLSRTNSAQSSTGVGTEFIVLTACVLGGVSVMGGRGTLFGAFVGVLIVGVLENGLVLLNVNSYVQFVLKGLILLAAVVYDSASKNSKGRVKKIGGIALPKAA